MNTLKNSLIQDLKGKNITFLDKPATILVRKQSVTDKKSPLYLLNTKEKDPKKRYISSLYPYPDKDSKLYFEKDGVYYDLLLPGLKVVKSEKK